MRRVAFGWASVVADTNRNEVALALSTPKLKGTPMTGVASLKQTGDITLLRTRLALDPAKMTLSY